MSELYTGPTFWRVLTSTFILCSACSSALGQSPKPDLAETSLETLLNMEVSSASRKLEKFFDTSAAIFVITADDIRRSGLTSIPELLRLVPGVEVAQIAESKWAVSIRGFNHLFADKLLVLVDGRSVYTSLFSGVYWDVQDVPLEEVERIEVIRGPGASVWGANAVNGVINITTKRATDTQGGLVAAGGGNSNLGFGLVRYGTRAGSDAAYRIFAKYRRLSPYQQEPGRLQHRSWRIGHAGFRSDWQVSPQDSLTVQGDLYRGAAGGEFDSATLVPPFTAHITDDALLAGGNLLSRWTREVVGGSQIAFQFYFDHTKREETLIGQRHDTSDFDFQHHLVERGHHDVIWGLGYRLIADSLRGSSISGFDPPRRRVHLFSAFLSDEIMLVRDRLRLTVGSKFERNSYSGFEIQPTLRVFWSPLPRHAVWAAVSRAVRTPARFEHDVNFVQLVSPGPGGLPFAVTLVGNREFKSQTLVAFELGYRVQPASVVSLDLALFLNRYRRLRTADPDAPFVQAFPPPARVVVPVRFGNNMQGRTYGGELAVNWRALHRWKLSGSYSFLREQLQLLSPASDQGAALVAGDNPRHQFNVGSLLSLPARLELDTHLYFVGRLPNQAVSRYARFDLRLGWRPAESLQLSLVGQSLFIGPHIEFNSITQLASTSVIPRSAYAQFTWSF